MFFEEFNLEMEWPLDRVKITRQEMLDFAQKYDSAPIHVDEEYGKKSRFGDIIAPGTMTAMKLWNEWQNYNIPGDEFIAGTQCKMEWFIAVMDGDELYGRAYVSEKIDRNRFNGMVYIVVEGYNQRDEMVLRTTNMLVMKKLPVNSPSCEILF